MWSRKKVVTEFEEKWAQTIGAKRCLAVVNGTNALFISLAQCNVGAGDEVIIPAYTFIGSVVSVLQTGAIPVFVDTNPETFQIDENKIESKITLRTKAIMPVHIAGLPANMERILAIAKKHNLFVIEDACQGHLAEINHKKVGTFGQAGCFSFQNSKTLPIGEGGAIVSDDSDFIDRCYSFHNFGFPYGTAIGSGTGDIFIKGTKLRLTEYQAAIGLAQLARLDDQTTVRNENAAYLKTQLQEIKGILPYKLNEHVTRCGLLFFPMRYKKESFSGLSREAFIEALNAEGVPVSSGYKPLNNQPFLKDAFDSKNFRRTYPKKILDFNKYSRNNQCPENDRICNEEAVWIDQTILLTEKTDMDQVRVAIEKIQQNAEKIKLRLNK